MKDKKKILTMTKEHSPHLITFSPDEDSHFFNIEIIRKSTGEVKGQHFILKSDVPSWIGMYEAEGFEIITNNE